MSFSTRERSSILKCLLLVLNTIINEDVNYNQIQWNLIYKMIFINYVFDETLSGKHISIHKKSLPSLKVIIFKTRYLTRSHKRLSFIALIWIKVPYVISHRQVILILKVTVLFKNFYAFFWNVYRRFSFKGLMNLCNLS